MKIKIRNVASILVLSAACAGPAFAGWFTQYPPLPTAADSWEVIASNRRVSQITQGAYSERFGPEGYFNACVDGDTFRSLKPLKSCIAGRWMHGGGSVAEAGGSQQYVCDEHADQQVVLSRHQVLSVCVAYSGSRGQDAGDGGVCIRHAQRAIMLPVTMKFGVYNYVTWGGQESGGSENRLIFTKDFTVPSCGGP